MVENAINPVRRAVRRYFVEFGISMAAYMATIFFSRWLLRGPMRHADELSQIAVALLPVIPFALVFAAIVRIVLRTDELNRRIYIESLALAGGATALLAVTYGLIEGDRFPHPSAWWTYVTFMIVWLVASFFVRRRYQ
jgi:hypothetical protein